jgi:hypothetical protein
MKRSNCISLMAGIVLSLLLVAPARASLSQGYSASSDIAAGSLVSLDSKKSSTVETSTLDNAPRLFGVVVPPSSASISLSGIGSNQVQVATTGSANVFVTNAAGSIKVGDQLTVSSIAGVAEKVGDTSSRVIGTAQADFDGSGSGVTKRTITDAKGKSHEVAISQIPVVIAVSTFTSTSGKQPYVIPNWLQNLSNTLAGKDVAPIRIVVAGLILLVALVCITVLLYAAVRNSIISIGRNPLSRNSVLKGLLQVMTISAGILGLAAASIYFVIAR